MNENGSQRVYELEQVLKKPGRKPDGQQEDQWGASKRTNGEPTRGPMGGASNGANEGANKRTNGEPTKRPTEEPTERMTTGWTAV